MTHTICNIRMHQNLPFFHEKTAKNWPFFGQKLSLLASDKQLKTPPPYFEGAGCEKASCSHTQVTQTQFTASVCTKISHFS